jgi:predicted branched-subunit amino acid permease
MIHLILIALCLIFYGFLIYKARNDETHGTCDSSWWLMFIAILNFIYWILIVCIAVHAGYIDPQKFQF